VRKRRKLRVSDLSQPQRQKKKAPRLPVHITDISYRVKKMGNLVKSSFESQVSRSPRTNPICGVSETDRNPVIGPGYYYL